MKYHPDYLNITLNIDLVILSKQQTLLYLNFTLAQIYLFSHDFIMKWSGYLSVA